MKAKLEKVGTLVYIENKPYCTFGEGYNNFYKDEEIYHNDKKAICYVPSSDKTIVGPDGNKYGFMTESYSHQDLLKLCRQNQRMCDELFELLDGMSPDSYIGQFDEWDLCEFWGFVKNGVKVYWNDPTNQTSGVYEVIYAPSRDEQLEIGIEDTIVLIGNEYSKAEVYITELSEIKN